VFQVAIKQQLTAFHHLIGGDWGSENQHHSHDYAIEIIVEAETLDRHGYLFDIAELRVHQARVHERYAGADLNQLPEFRDQNPSVERFAQYDATESLRGLRLPGATHLTIKIWEDPDTWASYRTRMP
jgi:6-pyruvoyltetrahydropterin/6-carboxytetrahydropterin synthase